MVADTFAGLTDQLKGRKGVRLIAFRGPDGKWRAKSWLQLVSPSTMKPGPSR